MHEKAAKFGILYFTR